MFCRFCGFPLEEDARFCSACGKPVRETDGEALPQDPAVGGDTDGTQASPAAESLTEADAPELQEAAGQPPEEAEAPAEEALPEPEPDIAPDTASGEEPSGEASGEPQGSERKQAPYPAQPPAPPAGRVVLVETGSHAPFIVIILLLILLCGAGAAYVLGLWGVVPLPVWIPQPSQQTLASSPSSPEESQAASLAEGEGEPEISMPDEAPTDRTPEQLALSQDWPPFPHVSDIYHFARQDGEDVYFLPQAGQNRLPLNIYRLNKDGALNIVVNLSLNPESAYAAYEPTVSTFALHGGYIYFGSRLVDGKCGYYRVPKTGGNVEFLFLEEFSCMVPAGEQIYFLFPQAKCFGVYTPGTETDIVPTLEPLTVESWPDESARPLYQFSVFQGMLYYGVYTDIQSSYFRQDLETGALETLLSAEELGPNIVRPTWTDDAVYYVQRDADSGLDSWRRLQDGPWNIWEIYSEKTADKQVMFMARLRDYFLYQIGDNFMWSRISDPNDASIKLSSRLQPFAVTDDWIFLPDRMIPVEEQANPVSMVSAAAASLGDFTEAFEEAMSLLGVEPQPPTAPEEPLTPVPAT